MKMSQVLTLLDFGGELKVSTFDHNPSMHWFKFTFTWGTPISLDRGKFRIMSL